MEEIKNITKKIKKSKLLKAQIVVIIVCLFLGTLLHFTYKWSGKNLFVASFSAVNESVWEHLKLVFYPMLLMAIIEYQFVKDEVHNYIKAKTIGIFVSISFIVISFFTYSGIIGTSFLLIDIIIFIISIILGEIVSYKLMNREEESTNKSRILSAIIFIFLLISFIFYTYNTPKVNLFKDPETGVYGIENS